MPPFSKKNVFNRLAPLLAAPGVLFLAHAAHAQPTSARDGANSGGGGDTQTEMRIDEIRADILSWIGKGGAERLNLPPNLSHDAYRVAMTRYLQPHAVVIGSVTSAQEAATSDPELKVTVNGQPKTCRGFVSTRDKLPHILCNAERFAATSERDQYPLIHHEYAGLAGIERNIGASSDYSISQQIAESLVYERVLKLAVKDPVETPNRQCQQQAFFWDAMDAGSLKDPKESDFAITSSCKQLPRDWDAQSGLKPFVGQKLALISGTQDCKATMTLSMGEQEIERGASEPIQTLELNDFEAAVFVRSSGASFKVSLADDPLPTLHHVPSLKFGEATTIFATAIGAFGRPSTGACGPEEVQMIGDFAGDDNPKGLGTMRIDASTCLQTGDGLVAEVVSRTPAKDKSYELFSKSRTQLTVLDADQLLVQISNRMMKSEKGVRRGFVETQYCVYENTHSPAEQRR
jgi:hypothetical protein